MTTLEIQREWNYRYEERLALAAGAGRPSAGHFATAKGEADEWKAAYLKQMEESNV